MKSPEVLEITPYLYELVWQDEPDAKLLQDMLTYQKFLKKDFQSSLVTSTMGFQRIGLQFSTSITKSRLTEALEKVKAQSVPESRTKKWRIPVHYDGKDLQQIAAHHSCSTEEVVYRHSHTDYLLYFYGFLPGFPYLVPTKAIEKPPLRMPRKSTPDTVKAGSVGLAESQTGVYPSNSPGGWQILGRTPVRFLRLDHQQPIFARPGDTIRFTAITKQEFDAWPSDKTPDHD